MSALVIRLEKTAGDTRKQQALAEYEQTRSETLFNNSVQIALMVLVRMQM